MKNRLQTGLWVRRLGAALCLSAAAAGTSTPPVLKSALQIQQLDEDRASAGLPAELHLVVTLWVPERTWFIAQDSTGGLYLDMASAGRLLPMNTALQPGDRIILIGRAARGLFAPVLRPSVLIRTGAGPAPEPLRASVEHLLQPGVHNRLVEVEGRVASFTTNQTLPLAGVADLILLDADGRPLRAQFPAGSLASLAGSLAGRRVRVRGVASIELSPQGQALGPQLLCHGADGITVLRAETSLFRDRDRLPLEDLDSLLRYGDDRMPGLACRVRGRVVYTDDGSLVIQNGDASISAPRSILFEAEPGMHLELAGKVSVTAGGYLTMENALAWRLEEPAPHVEPRRVTASMDVFDLARGVLTELEAEVAALPGRSGNQNLEVDFGEHRIRVFTPFPVSGPQQLHEGDRIRLRGLLRRDPVQLGGPSSEQLRMYVGRRQDVELTQRAPWSRRLPWAEVSLVTAVGLATALAWGWTLRREVRLRTLQLEKANLELAAARESAERSSRAKSILLGMASHDIRNPLHGIAGLLELAQQESEPAELRSQIRLAGETARSLIRLLEDLLDYTRLEAGRIEVAARPFSLPALIRNLAQLWCAGAEAKGLQFRAVFDPRLPEWVSGDELRLRQALENLLANAVKFTSSGEVSFRVQPCPGGVRFEVSDTGPGVPAERLEEIFEPFEQASPATQSGSGAGLGLAITRQLVAAMGGRIAVQSEPGRGSCFRFELPLDPIPAPAGSAGVIEQPSGFPMLRGVVLLAVEDNAVLRLLVRRLLEQEGCRVESAATLAEARLRLSDPAPLDAVLIDLQLPDGSGLELAAEARHSRPGLPLIAATAHSNPATAAAALEAGFSACLTKPFSRSTLVEAILRSLSAGQAPVPEERTDSGSASSAPGQS